MTWNPGNVPAFRVTAFWLLVDRSAGADACWPFAGYINVSLLVNGKKRPEAGGPIATTRRYYKRRNYPKGPSS